ncbi:MAG TPA: VPLPA-CTERM sorting domain-containing protein [Gammaproteobacteria bacterium]|nr:VPLPA-CTERM sorting domain-containing protein [Gammaproteobacteria bacterium]
MTKSRPLAAVAAAALICGTTFAQADSFDFLALGNSNERGYAGFTHSAGGISVEATGSSADGKTPYFAYLDSGNAGLGVCKALTASNQCTPSSDDNVTFNELLRLDFNRTVTLSEILFVNGSHGTTFSGTFDLVIDGGPQTSYSLAHLFTMDLTGKTFDFINPNLLGDTDNLQQFYISSVEVSAVPVPAAAWLFVSGILGLVTVARRHPG